MVIQALKRAILVWCWSLPLQAAPGFIFLVGGGASRSPSGIDKPAQIEIFKAVLSQLKAGPRRDSKFCYIDFHPQDDDSKASVETLESQWQQAGGEKSDILYRSFPTIEAANGGEADQIKYKCGIAYIPGGDQSVIRGLWKESRLVQSLRMIYLSGGGLMGKSAGAAVLGTLGFFPEPTNEASAAWASGQPRLAESELEHGFVFGPNAMFPLFYVETHTGDREREVRAAALLALWNHKRSMTPSGFSPFAILVDSDTGILLTFSNDRQVVGKVFGARAVEILRPSDSAKSGVNQDGTPFYHGLRSDVLLDRDTITLDSHVPHVGQNHIQPSIEIDCLWPDEVKGNDWESVRKYSEFDVFARTPAINQEQFIDLVDDAWLFGDIRFYGQRCGCGYWQGFSFSQDVGIVPNRLNLQRFLLGSRSVSFAVQVPETSVWRRHGKNGAQLVASKGFGQSSIVTDVSKAIKRRVSRYIYTEYGANNPVLTGGWRGATVHLLAPGDFLKIL